MTEPAERLSRLTSPALDDILGQKFPVLDDGFVRVIDYMGTDAAIVQAARVSYGAGTKAVSEDRGLIRYLLRHRHTTPFEMCELKLHVRVPMDCWRQWIRHRSACLAGSTELYFDMPGAAGRGGRRLQKTTIADLYRRWHQGSTHAIPKKKPTFVERVVASRQYTVAELAQLVERRPEDLRNTIRSGHLRATRIPVSDPRQPAIRILGADWHTYAETQFHVTNSLRSRLETMRLRQVNEETLAIQHTRIVDVFHNGVRPVFRMTLDDGKTIDCTADHQFLFADGWKTLKAATDLMEVNGKAVWSQSDAYLYANGIDLAVPALYQDREWLHQRYNIDGVKIADIASECAVSYATIRKWLKQHGLTHEKGGRSKEPWNKGKQYVLGERTLTATWREANRRARSGAASNFWKGGMSTQRETIGRWTTQRAFAVHERNGWTCQLCHQRAGVLHAHHVVPVWAEPSLACDEANLTTLCGSCHRSIHGRELDFVERLGGPTVKAEWVKRPRVAWNKLTVAKLVRITSFEFLGYEDTYDVEVEGPFHNFVANGIVTHNSVNEYSTRYSIAIDAAQTTATEEWRIQAKDNKQGSSGYLDAGIGASLTAREKALHEQTWAVYQERLEAGVAREQARKDLPLSTYTEAYWKIDLHNLLHFLALRMDSHAQQEIRDYATVIGEQIVSRWVPMAWEAFLDYRFNGQHLSQIESAIIAAVGGGKFDEAVAIATERGLLTFNDAGQPKRNRERAELEAKLRQFNLTVPWPTV